MYALERTVESLQGDLGKANKKIEQLGRTSKGAAGGVANLAKGLIAAAGAYLTIQKAAELAGNAIRESVARDSAEQSLSLLAKSYGEVADAQLLVERSAQKFGQSQTEATKAIATTYARLRPLGATLTEIESVYNGFNTAARLSGASASESAGAFRQLTQALGSGALRGDEFNSIAEQAPLLLQAVSKETGVAVGALRDYAAEGLITSDVVVRALERIEKEGAAGLAEALQTPEQAFVDLTNAAEDLNVEVGRILQPAVLEFVRALTEQFRQMTADIDKTRKAAEFLTEKLGFLAEVGDAVAGAFDRMGIGFAGFVSTVIKNLPVIGAAVQMLEKLGMLRDNWAQAQDNSKGGRNFGEDYAAQEKALFAAAGGWSPYKEGGGIASQFGGGTETKGGSSKRGGGSRDAERAARDAERLAEQTAERLLSAEKLITAAQREGELLNANSEFEKAQIESKNAIFEIAEKYGELAAKSLSTEETNLLLQAQGLEIQNERVALAEKEAKAIKSATQPLLDQQQFLQDAITLGREEATIRQQIRQAMEGLPEAERARVESLIRGNQALEDQLSTMDQMKELAGSISDTIENGLVNALGTAVEGLITGAEDLDESLKKILQGVLKDIANQMIKAGISSLFQSIGGGGGGGIFAGLFRAEGGPVAGGQSYIVGEKGPEIFTPGLTGNITSNSDSKAAMANYSGGNASTAMAMAPMAANVTYSGPTLNFNGDDYIPRSEASNLVAAGAKQGQDMAMKRLQNSRSQRARLGL